MLSRKGKYGPGAASGSEWERLILLDDRAAWEKHLELRARFEREGGALFSRLDIMSGEEARERGYATVSAVLREFSCGREMNFSPSHGLGHALRDYLHALLLAQADQDGRDAYLRIVAGTLHDVLGCGLVARFDEKERSIRHAEASALLFWELGQRIGMREEERLLVYYALAAHTNYQESMTIVGLEGEVRRMEPYRQEFENGEPAYFIHAVQEVDRLDISGACGFFRHYLAVAEALGREIYLSGTGKFSPVSFQEHMRPLLRPVAEIAGDRAGATMRELMFYLAQTQNGESVYGCRDGARMAGMRDLYCRSMLRILDGFDRPQRITSGERDGLFAGCNRLIARRIEPTEQAEEAAVHLQELFYGLPEETQTAWFGAMASACREYEAWRLHFQEEISWIPDRILSLPGLGDAGRIVL